MGLWNGNYNFGYYNRIDDINIDKININMVRFFLEVRVC